MSDEIVNAVLIKNSIKRLQNSIEEFNSQTVAQNKRMVQLTYIITFLTFSMLIAVGAQIYISVYKPMESTTVTIEPKQTTSKVRSKNTDNGENEVKTAVQSEKI